jgi:hypothetical protein
MHPSDSLDWPVRIGLAAFYFVAVLGNFAYSAFLRRKKDAFGSTLWGAVGVVFLLHAVRFLIPGIPDSFRTLPKGFRDFTTWLMGLYGGQMGPILFVGLSIVGFIFLIWFRKFFTQPAVAWSILNLSLLFAGWSMTDWDFRQIVTKADNVPIVLLIYSVGFFTWLALRMAVINDERMARGEPPMEKLEDEKVLVWPDLVYTELIAMIVCTAVLIVWAIVLKAPLEQPATSAKAPNPSKAPWYFLGLQEMLVYYDPWLAGIVLPILIMIGLIAIPYIDFNQKGNGYFTFVQRAFAISSFLFGFLVLWVVLIVLGTFLRGPNWNFFGPYEYWDPHKVLPLNNINLSDYFWQGLLGTNVNRPGVISLGMDEQNVTQYLIPGWLVRELPGILLIAGYLFVLPPLLARTVFRKFFIRMGFLRYMVMMVLLLGMASLPLKMVLRWAFNLKYIVYIPELFFNI